MNRLKNAEAAGLNVISIGGRGDIILLKDTTGRADMNDEFANRINEEVERYKNALLHYAKQCEWDSFKSKAGALFDYLEAIELSEIQRKFFRMFRLILIVLVMIIVIILKMNGEAYPALLRFKDSLVITAIAGSCFELYFFLNFRLYVEHKMSWYKQRREQFIRNMEKDFKEIIVQPVCSV
jgi:hypothetical protein